MAKAANSSEFHSKYYDVAQDKTNADWVNDINAYWGRKVVGLESKTMTYLGRRNAIYKVRYERVVSLVGPWPNGFPP